MWLLINQNCILRTLVDFFLSTSSYQLLYLFKEKKIFEIFIHSVFIDLSCIPNATLLYFFVFRNNIILYVCTCVLFCFTITESSRYCIYFPPPFRTTRSFLVIFFLRASVRSVDVFRRTSTTIYWRLADHWRFYLRT